MRPGELFCFCQTRETMREKTEKLVLLPFALGCLSESSVAVASPNQNEPRSKDDPGECTKFQDMQGPDDREREECSSDESMKNSFVFVPVQKPNTSTGIHRLYKGLKSFSQLFVSKEDMEEEEVEVEIEIGDPTDVKHMTHIGWDGCVAMNNLFLGKPMSELPFPPASYEAETLSSGLGALSSLSN